jgi:hypothetical protein
MIKITARIIALFIFVGTFSGCAGMPVGWGGTHKVTHKDASSISIQYDGITESADDVRLIAEKHCAIFGKNAKVSSIVEDPSTLGIIKTYVYQCISSGATTSEPNASSSGSGTKDTAEPHKFSYKAAEFASTRCTVEGAPRFLSEAKGVETYHVNCFHGTPRVVNCNDKVCF